MQNHNMHLYGSASKWIQSKLKTIDVRIYDEKRRKVSIGDYITFITDSDEEIQVRVVGILVCETFSILYDMLNVLHIGYTFESEANYTDMYKYYSKEEENKYGVIGIAFEYID